MKTRTYRKVLLENGKIRIDRHISWLRGWDKYLRIVRIPGSPYGSYKSYKLIVASEEAAIKSFETSMPPKETVIRKLKINDNREYFY